MSIPVDCPGCKAHYEAPDKFAGQRMKCKACGTVLTVPTPELEPLEDELAPLEDELAPLEDERPAVQQPQRQPAARQPAARQPAVQQPAVEQPAAFAPSRLDDLLDDTVGSHGAAVARPAGARAKIGANCPECRAPMDPEDVVCMECGYNVAKKKSAKPKVVAPAHGAPALKKKKKKVSSSGPKTGMPTKIIVAFALDIPLCLLQAAVGFLGLTAMMVPDIANKIPPLEKLQIFSAAGVALFGLSGNLLMFLKQKWAWGLGYSAVACSALNIAVIAIGKFSALQAASEMHKNIPTSYKAGAMGGIMVAVVLRGAYAMWYGSNVAEYEEWVGGPKTSDSVY